MADRKGLQLIGYLLGATTTAVVLVAAMFVVNIEPGQAEQATLITASSGR